MAETDLVVLAMLSGSRWSIVVASHSVTDADVLRLLACILPPSEGSAETLGKGMSAIDEVRSRPRFPPARVLKSTPALKRVKVLLDRKIVQRALTPLSCYWPPMIFQESNVLDMVRRSSDKPAKWPLGSHVGELSRRPVSFLPAVHGEAANRWPNFGGPAIRGEARRSVICFSYIRSILANTNAYA
ncbi:hypothetical protein NL676_031901 [Syzygium grande]|nr:hypothetical protein NL676_031901 [Syzygium grande]